MKSKSGSKKNAARKRLTDRYLYKSAISPAKARSEGSTFFDWTDSLVPVCATYLRWSRNSELLAAHFTPSQMGSILKALLPMSLWPYWVGQLKWKGLPSVSAFQRRERALNRAAAVGVGRRGGHRSSASKSSKPTARSESRTLAKSLRR